MNNTMRNLTLSAAALAALTVIAPTAAAQEHGRGGERGNTPRQSQGPSYRGNESHGGGSRAYGGSRGDSDHGGYGNYGNRGSTGRGAYGGYGGYGGYGRAYVAPRPLARYGYGYGHGYGYAAPFRVFSGIRFYAACPGPRYVYIANYGWVLPPFFGAVWIPGHYDIGGFWVEGFWR